MSPAELPEELVASPAGRKRKSSSPERGSSPQKALANTAENKPKFAKVSMKKERLLKIASAKDEDDWQFWSLPTLFGHVILKCHPLGVMCFPALKLDSSMQALKFAMTAAGSHFVSTLFFEYNGVAPVTPGGINCETAPPPSPLVIGVVSLIFKTCAVFCFGYMVQRSLVKEVLNPMQKRRLVKWWVLQEVCLKMCAAAYISFCCFYLLAFSCLISEQAFQAYYQSIASSTALQFVIYPFAQVVVIFPILAFPETCKQIIDTFPFLSDFSHEYEIMFE
jgi:hypothetical protein